MAATFAMSETYGTSPGTTADTSYVNLMTADMASGSDTTTNTNAHAVQIPASGNAYTYEKWIRAHFTGTFTQISNVLLWKQSGTVPANCHINAAATSGAYATPVVTASSIATADIPTTSGTALDISPASPLVAAGYSKYAVLQGVVASTATNGNSGAITYRTQWNEI